MNVDVDFSVEHNYYIATLCTHCWPIKLLVLISMYVIVLYHIHIIVNVVICPCLGLTVTTNIALTLAFASDL